MFCAPSIGIHGAGQQRDCSSEAITVDLTEHALVKNGRARTAMLSHISFKLARSDSVVGKLPDNKLPRMSRDCRRANRPIWLGNVPSSLFSSSDKFVRLVKRPTWVGIVPNTLVLKMRLFAHANAQTRRFWRFADGLLTKQSAGRAIRSASQSSPKIGNHACLAL